MARKAELLGSDRNLSYSWEDIPADSPLSESYAQMLVVSVTERATPSVNFNCQVKPCDKNAWMIVRENPLKLMDHDGNTVDLNELDPELAEQIEQSRKKVAAICKAHLMERFLDSIDEGQ
jgi:hypothetical protein